MAELHEKILVDFRRKFLKRGFCESKSPTPTYRPDVFARKSSKNGIVTAEIIAEAEIKSTLFTDHTSEQLVTMHEYITVRQKKRILVSAYLVVPIGKEILSLSKSLLNSLDIENIQIVQF
jgi:hypothetical protein